MLGTRRTPSERSGKDLASFNTETHAQQQRDSVASHTLATASVTYSSNNLANDTLYEDTLALYYDDDSNLEEKTLQSEVKELEDSDFDSSQASLEGEWRVALNEISQSATHQVGGSRPTSLNTSIHSNEYFEKSENQEDLEEEDRFELDDFLDSHYAPTLSQTTLIAKPGKMHRSRTLLVSNKNASSDRQGRRITLANIFERKVVAADTRSENKSSSANSNKNIISRSRTVGRHMFKSKTNKPVRLSEHRRSLSAPASLYSSFMPILQTIPPHNITVENMTVAVDNDAGENPLFWFLQSVEADESSEIVQKPKDSISKSHQIVLNDIHIFDQEDDPSNIVYAANADPLANYFSRIIGARPEKLVEKLSANIDYESLSTFLMTFRYYMTPMQLLKLLLLRFEWTLIDNSDNRRVVRLRTFVMLRYWIEHFYEVDFNGQSLKQTLLEFLQTTTHHLNLSSVSDQRMLQKLRDLVMTKTHIRRASLQSLAAIGAPTVGILSTPDVHQARPRAHTLATPTSAGYSTTSKNETTSNNKAPKVSWTRRISSQLGKHLRRTQAPTNATAVLNKSQNTTAEIERIPPWQNSPLMNLTDSSRRHSAASRASSSYFSNPGYESTYCSPETQDESQPRRYLPLMTERSSTLAQHLCLIESEMLQAVHWTELLNLSWTNKTQVNPRVSILTASKDALYDEDLNNVMLRPSENVISMIERFNKTCQWIVSEIVSLRSQSERVLLIEKLIRISSKCLSFDNYNSLVAFMLALQNPSVERLRGTWRLVSENERAIFEELVTFTSPLKNFKHVRDAMSDMQQSLSRPCVPFLGLYLSDLVFNAERPNRMDDTYNLINLHKFNITAGILERFRAMQNPERARYNFPMKPELFHALHSLQSSVPLDQESLHQMSLECEP